MYQTQLKSNQFISKVRFVEGLANYIENMTLTIYPFGNSWQNHKHNYERSIKQQSPQPLNRELTKPNYYNELLKNFARKEIMAWKTCNLS